ncbi:hypothetical protein C8J57DRAFT_132574 [Mycena rebaudengoi]|nr:hypothetical protein C8J57DRAFT_132574 [Mycena rebaudengoi]
MLLFAATSLIRPLGRFIIVATLIRACSSALFVNRQSSAFDPGQIPTTCQDPCAFVINNANTCTTFQCLCTPKNNAAVLSCVDCVISFNRTGSVIISGQDILNQFATQCNIRSLSISSLSASGAATVSGLTTSSIRIPSAPITTSSQPFTTSITPSSPSPSSSAAVAHRDRHFLLWPSCIAVSFLVVLTLR